MEDHKLMEVFRNGLMAYQKAGTDRRLHKKGITAFFPLEGAEYSAHKQLMIVGRSVNGWLKGVYSAETLGDQGVFEGMWKEIFDHKYGSEDPMALITNDWYREDAPFWRSAFFRVAKKVGRKLDVVAEDAEDWSSYLVWSNLFKVAPRDGGNPGLLMQRAQEPWCYSLLKKELDTYKPKRVLFMTGYDQWAEPFLDFLRFKAKRLSRDKPVEAFGKIPLSNGASTDVVVTQHPQGKPEEELVDQIAKAFRTL